MHTRLRLPLVLLALAPLCPAHAQTAAPQAVTKPTINVLYSFDVSQEGINPLTVGPDGALYGAAPYGGAANGGLVFKVTRGGLFHKIADFYEQNGRLAEGPLLLMPNGTLMGTTIFGGKSGTGSLFLLTLPHRFQTKHEFAALRRDASGSDTLNDRGAYPGGALVLGTDGAVYGTTNTGGSRGNGVVYRWTAAHGVEVVHDFLGGTSDGAGPAGGVVLGQDGALYGLTFSGGLHTHGILYRLTTDGLFTVLHSFDHNDDLSARSPEPPTVGADGDLYGTTCYGGASDRGVFYRCTPDGTYTVLSSLPKNTAGYEVSALTLGPDSDFYGIAAYGGTTGYGSVFRLSPAGVLTTVYSFTATGAAGSPLTTGVTFGSDGALYGNTYGGGAHGFGTVYRLRLP